MSNDKIEEIRARHEEGMRAGADEDRAYLLAEVERLHKAHQAACEGGDLLRAELMQAIGLLEARLDTAIRERDEARAEVERLHKAHEAACRGGEWLLAEKVSLRARMCGEISDLRAENERLIRERDEARAEVERLRAEKEDLYASIAGIERAAAGAIYSQESIHAMALYALKPLMERGIEAVDAKP